MGNTTSSQRADFLQRDDRRFREIVSERGDRSRSPRAGRSMNRDIPRAGPSNPRPPTPRPPESRFGRDSNVYGTFRRQVSSQSITVQADAEDAVGTDEVTYEQEERPLVNMGDLGMRDAPITHITATNLARRQSAISRLGSRMLPNSVLRGLLSSGEETAAEGQALRRQPRTRPMSSTFERRTSQHNNNRFSIREALRSRTFAGSGTRRQIIRGPFPLRDFNDHLPQNEAAAHHISGVLPSGSSSTLERRPSPLHRDSRISRMRNSLSLPFYNIFGTAGDHSELGQLPRTPPRRPSRVAFADDSDHLLPPLSAMDHRLDFDDSPHELDAVEPETRNVLSSSRIGQASNSIRRLPHALRSRSTRLIRRGEHPPLSQVLQLAAAAIAAQLSGHANPSVSGIRTMGAEPFDGSIQNFVQTLQDAATAQAGESLDGNVADGNLPPVNFLRVFQFPNTDNNNSGSGQEGPGTPDPMEVDEATGEANNERTVTLVLVGVRSMPSAGDGSGDDPGNLGPSLDTLLSLPFLPPTNVLRNGSSGALFRRSDGRSRINSRRNSMTNFSSFPAQYESQRHQRTRSTVNRSPTDQVSLTPPNASLQTIMSESPPGPNPPPSTPADPRSGAATPSRRPSSASAVHSPALPDLLENPTSSLETEAMDTSFNTARQRRRSDSEFARRPELSSGASRRNGVVEPDNTPPPTGRSWLIYVVGTNVSPDHPAFTMPSLFTDNPSYEDMQLLSNLLGPVKPPVATQEDVTSAGGIFRIVAQDGSLTAQPPAGSDLEAVTILDGERCLICLCDYEAANEVRQLNKCRHVYHRECIDEVSATLMRHR